MAQFYKTENFIIDYPEQPFVSREDGGHLRIWSKDKSITDRTRLNSKQAIELMRLTMIVGEALEKGMNERGILVVKVNYHDMGNWAFKRNDDPVLHVQIFGRSKDAKKQVFPEAVYLPARESGFYDDFEPLNEEDIKVIDKYINSLFKEERYSNSEWGV